MTCVLPLMEYGIEVWYKESNKTQKEQLQRLQNRGLRRILGAVRDTPIAVLHVESAILPLHERWRLLVSRRALRLQYYISPTSPLAGLKPSGPRKKYSPIHCIQQLLEHDVQDPPPPIEDRRKPPWEEQWVDVDGAKWLRQYADKQILLLKKAEERWQEQYDNDPRGAWFRQMEPKMVCTTSVTQLRLKWMLRVEY